MSESATTLQQSGRAASTTYFAAVDYLRIVAAFAIICYHAGAPAASITFSGLHALTAAAAFFAARSRSGSSDAQIVRKRFDRIMIPWAFFSVLHLALALNDHKFQTWMIWSGGSMHLWFLPFIFIVTCLVALGARRGLFGEGYFRSAAWAGVGLAMIATELQFELSDKLPIPLPQFRNALPAALFGLAIFTFPRRSSMVARAAALVGFNVLMFAIWRAFRETETVPYPSVAIGTTLFAICLGIRLSPTTVSSSLGRWAFGVYLLQGLTIKAAFVALAQTPLRTMHASHPGPYCVMAAALAFLLGLVLVAVLERTPARRVIA